MSQSAAVRAARPAARPGPRTASRPTGRVPAPRLRVVSAPVHARSRAGLVVACLSVLAVGLVGLLLLNVSLEKGAFALRAQQQQIEQLSDQRQNLQEEIAGLEAPQSLASRASALGMVEAPGVAFVRLSDGRILGTRLRAVANKSATVTTSGSPAGGRAATPSPSGAAQAPATGPGTPAAKTTTPTKVTTAGGAGATTTTASSGGPASKATATTPAKPKAGTAPASPAKAAGAATTKASAGTKQTSGTKKTKKPVTTPVKAKPAIKTAG